jgi:hypothetical protein
VSNLPAETPVAEALRCFLPQGVNGCGFESQLESMYLGLVRATTPDEASYGFLRPDSVLAVVLVTDEVDCSYNKDWASIFEPDGNKVFWSDPGAAFPTSAVCWNAGVTCSGDPSAYDGCVATNKDVDGSAGVDDSNAVLHPLSRYQGLLEGLEQEIQESQPGRELVFGLIAGVQPDGSPFYADVSAIDPQYQADFGIGPGCESPSFLDPNTPNRAVPPVRALELGEEITPGAAASICEDSYAPALANLANRIVEQLP